MIPATAQSCASGVPKLDYGYYLANGSVSWSNVCGTGTWGWKPGVKMYAIRMFTSPTHRVWLHQNADNTGGNDCVYSQDQDVYASSIVSQLHSNWPDTPGNIQVSASTASC